MKLFCPLEVSLSHHIFASTVILSKMQNLFSCLCLWLG